MKIIVLTTNTLHHIHFVRAVTQRFPIHTVIVEADIVRVPFEIHHPFEDQQEQYEKQLWFDGGDGVMEDYVAVYKTRSVNDDHVLRYIRQIVPDIILVFGTRKISPEITTVCPKGALNLHGGDPEKYRGLDSHLWAIYHNDFSSLDVTLHRVNDILDNGDIVARKNIILSAQMYVYELRRHRTDLCVELVRNTLETFQKTNAISALPQKAKGRYYSFMPAVLKEQVVEKFAAYTAALGGQKK